MELKITIALDNVAFEEGGPDEVRRVLKELCQRLPDPLAKTSREIRLRDSNGNIVGSAEIV